MKQENVIALAPPVSTTTRLRMPLLLVRMFRYEFWPFWLLHIPAYFYWAVLAIRSRSMLYFTAANPGIEMGGFFGESKTAILENIPDGYLPASVYVGADQNFAEVLDAFQQKQMQYPVICKPDQGERGFLVRKIYNATELQQYHEQSGGRYIIQEFVAYETELGILYYRFPEGGSGISSVTTKVFLAVTGDGRATVRELMEQNVRARMRMTELLGRLGPKADTVLQNGERLLLEPIGNHCLGTMFCNGNKLITPELVAVFDRIAAQMDGFYFGRFDVRVASAEELRQGKNIRILEVNGTTSEPAHIYDPGMNLFKAWAAIFHNMHIVYRIAKQNRERGVAVTPSRVFLKTVRAHFRNKKQHVH